MSCCRRARLSRAAVLATLAALAPAGPAAAAEIEAFSSQAIVSPERHHALSGNEFFLRVSPRFAPEPANVTRVVLPIERRPGTSPGPVTVRLGTWTDNPNNEDVDYWIAQWVDFTQIPEGAIPVSEGPGYTGGTVNVPVTADVPIGDGNVMTLVVSAQGNPGDLVLGAADPLGDFWNVAMSRPFTGGQWSALADVYGARVFVVPVGEEGEEEPPPPTSWPFDGFRSPVNAEPTVNVVNAGSAVPLKFSLGEDRGLGVLAATPASQQVPCEPGVPSDLIEETVAASRSGLTYDPFQDEYAYVWKTDRDMAGTCRRFVLRLADGSTHTALFRMR